MADRRVDDMRTTPGMSLPMPNQHGGTPRADAVAKRRGGRDRADGDVSHRVQISGVAFETFYRQHRKSVVQAVALTVGDADLAAEGVDEAMVRAYQRWNTVCRLDAPAGWVYRVALNHCRSRLRRVARKFRYTAALTRGDEASTDVAFADRISDTRVLQAVRSLPFDQRAVIVTRILLALSEAQAAELLGVKPGTVKSRLNRALTALRAQLPDHADDLNVPTSIPTTAPTPKSAMRPPSTAAATPSSTDQETTS